MRAGSAVTLGLACLASCGPRDELGRFEFSEPHMGTEVRLVLWASDADAAGAAAAEGFRTVARLDSLFSDYRADSEVAEVAAAAGSGEAVSVTPELLAVLSAARYWSESTGGAFDVTVGPLTRLWRRAMRNGEFPDSSRLDEARAASGYQGLVLDTAGGTVRLIRAGMSLDLGGIAKGYVAQSVLDGLRRRGIPSALVDAGGDLALGDPPPGEAGWRVEFPGGEVHRLSGVGVATSGDRYQYLEAGGGRYSHILDPRTGVGIPSSPTVAVVAPDATTADALASALTVMDRESGRELASGIPGVAARVAWPDHGSASWQTPDFPMPPRRPVQENDS